MSIICTARAAFREVWRSRTGDRIGFGFGSESPGLVVLPACICHPFYMFCFHYRASA